jgi:hypothetical protein
LKKLFLFAAFLYHFCATAQNNYWQQQVDYVIDVSLNDKEHSIDGFEKINYINHSPDTLYFIWFHCWPNAYKNDKTAFSEQMLLNNRTDFYFSNKDQRGYINRLNFKVNGTTANTEDHPQHIDIIKLLLPQPLAPGAAVTITTPFHVQLPQNFSRGGHVGDAYQVTQWYPKPAVYDRNGWHPMPYLDQGEFYSEFGNYDVRITVPENYVVAATGQLQNAEEREWLNNRAGYDWKPVVQKTKKKNKQVKKTVQLYPVSAGKTKTIQFKQENIHDFAWFADKRFIVNHDAVAINGRSIDIYSYYLPTGREQWKRSTQMIKDAVRFRSEVMGAYPYSVVSAVEAPLGFAGGIEYPTITAISPASSEKSLQGTIGHEVGHNWLYAILANNERAYPWMDEGLNTYYDNRFEEWKKTNGTVAIDDERPGKFAAQRLPEDPDRFLLQSQTALKKDQPINTVSEKFNELNYGLITYTKTAQWTQLAENHLGQALFDSCMRTYYRHWQFKHPYPEDLKSIIATVSGKDTSALFALLDQTGPLPGKTKARQLKPALFFNFKNTDQYRYISFMPALGYNNYDKLMIGALVHNYTLPAELFRYVVAPLYSTNAKTLNGIGRLSYTWRSAGRIDKTELYISAAKFSTNATVDTFGNKVFEHFTKIAPGVRIYFKQPAISEVTSSLDLRVFLIREKMFDDYTNKSTDSNNVFPNKFVTGSRYITQLSYENSNDRALYPYRYQLQVQQGESFYRINVNGNYFFNYAKGGGLSARLFAAKFGYIGSNKSNAFIYQPKLLGVRGEEDYTYSNYFLGRTASISNADGPVLNKGLAQQQIMIRDGGFKMVLDQYDFLQGRSEDWVAAANFNTTLPNGLFPVQLPIRLFFDIGTYAEAWGKNAQTSKFLYVGGVQISILKDIVNVYVPILYSKDFKDYIKATWPEKRLAKSISFSIDIQKFKWKKVSRTLSLME